MTHTYPQIPRNRLKTEIWVDKIPVVTDGSGNTTATGDLVNGELLMIAYDKGTVTSPTTATVTTSTPLTGSVTQQIDSYDVNTGSAYRYPRAAVLSSKDGDNKWVPFVVHDRLTATVFSGQHNAAFTVYVYYR